MAPVTEVAAPTASAVPATTSAASRREIDAQAFGLRLAQRQRVQRAAGGGQQAAPPTTTKGSTSQTWVQLLSASEPSSQFMIS